MSSLLIAVLVSVFCVTVVGALAVWLRRTLERRQTDAADTQVRMVQELEAALSSQLIGIGKRLEDTAHDQRVGRQMLASETDQLSSRMAGLSTDLDAASQALNEKVEAVAAELERLRPAIEPAVEHEATTATVFSITDPGNPDREALVEFIPESTSDLIGRARPLDGDEARKYGYALDAVIGALPAGGAVAQQALQAGQVMRVVGPPEAVRGLATGAMKYISKDGAVLGTVKDAGTGMFSGQLRFKPDQVSAINPATGALILFQVMAVASGQYFMKRIDSKLSELDRTLNRVEQRLIGKTRAQLEVAREVSERIEALIKGGVTPTEQDLNELTNADHLARLSFHEARDSLIVASSEWTAFMKGTSTDRTTFHALIQAATRARESDAPLLIYSAALRGRIELMRLILESGSDTNRARVLAQEYESSRGRVLDELASLRESFGPLVQLTDKKVADRFETFFGGVSDIQTSLRKLRGDWKDLDKEITAAKGFIPEAPKIEAAPSVIEVRRSAAGELEVVSATLRAA